METITRKEARHRGLLTYFGKACPNSHHSPRYSSSGECLACLEDKKDPLRRRKYRSKDREKRRERRARQKAALEAGAPLCIIPGCKLPRENKDYCDEHLDELGWIYDERKS